MAILAWCLLALLLLTSTKGQRYNTDSQAFYGKSESASPEPKQILLYLTSDEVKKLEANGAVVNPLSESENKLLQQQQQKNAEEEAGPQYQPIYTEDSKQGKELEDYYKSSIQQIKEGLNTKSQSGEEAISKPVLRYEYGSNPQYWEYSTLFSQNKNNKEKAYSSETVQYLPNYYTENSKIERYRTLPIPGYRFEDIKVNAEPKKYLPDAPQLRKPVEIKNSKQFRQLISDLTHSSNLDPIQTKQIGEKIELSNYRNTGPVTFTRNFPQSSKVWEPAPVRESHLIWKSNDDGKDKIQAVTPATIQRQYSSLLAPLAQHEKITQTILEQKDLINSEHNIHSKLRELKESDNHDEEKYTSELEKLKKNLGEQNALAKKLAFETTGEKSQSLSQSLPKSQGTFKTRLPTDSWKQIAIDKPRPVLLQTPTPSVPKWPDLTDSFRPIPAPVLQTENIKVEEPFAIKFQKPLPISENENYYIKHEQPYIFQKETERKYGVPSTLTVLRNIWEH